MTGDGGPGSDGPRSTLGPAATLVLATRNRGKLAELTRLLAGTAWRPVSLDDAGVEDELAEPGPGYVENALAKATAARARTGRSALGEDSGIEVLALRGWPGPLSARWHGGDDGDRLRALLEEVERRSPDDRRVRYVAVVALARPESEPVLARGHCDGTLVAPRGRSGFGYDPGFLSVDLGITLAEATDAQKDRVSHRARALRRLAESGVLDWPAALLEATAGSGA